MVSAGDFRNGLTIEIDGTVYQIIEFQHVKPGKGAAFVRTKLKNVVDGGVVEKTFRPTEKYPQAHIDKKEMQYLYNDGDLYYFMDNESYENIPTKTDPGFKGDTATNATKPATLETGAEIRVPLFINEGDMIRVDTRTGEYMERA